MQTIKVDRDTFNNFRELQEARAKKSEGEKAEKTIKARLTLPDVETCFMFDGKAVAMLTVASRSGVDLEKLKKEFPKAFAACQTENNFLVLKVTL